MSPSSQGSVCIYLIKIQFESQPSVLKIIYEEAAEGQTWGETTGVSLSTSRNFTFSSGKLCEGQKRRLNKPLPSPPDCGKVRFHARFHSTLGQIKNHSPVCKPPVLQGVGNLEQETTVTHTLTSLSLTPCSIGWGMERLQKTEMLLSAQACAKPHTSDGYRSGEGILHFKLFKRYSFFPGSSLSCT